MKHYVFIARDEEEFSRYPSLRGGFHEKTPGFIKSIRYIEEDGYCVLILPSEAKCDNVDGVAQMCVNAAAAIKAIGHDYNDADKVCVLVHMGGEGDKGVDKWEADFNKQLRGIKENWSIKLLSSTRKGIIDVTAGTITIPERDDLERLTTDEGLFDENKFVDAFNSYPKVNDDEKKIYIEKAFVNADGQENIPSGIFIPLILCRNKESLRSCGVICPREYIVDLSVFEKATYNKSREFVLDIENRGTDEVERLCSNWLQAAVLEYNEGAKGSGKSLKKAIGRLLDWIEKNDGDLNGLLKKGLVQYVKKWLNTRTPKVLKEVAQKASGSGNQIIESVLAGEFLNEKKQSKHVVAVESFDRILQSVEAVVATKTKKYIFKRYVLSRVEEWLSTEEAKSALRRWSGGVAEWSASKAVSKLSAKNKNENKANKRYSKELFCQWMCDIVDKICGDSNDAEKSKYKEAMSDAVDKVCEDDCVDSAVRHVLRLCMFRLEGVGSGGESNRFSDWINKILSDNDWKMKTRLFERFVGSVFQEGIRSAISGGEKKLKCCLPKLSDDNKKIFEDVFNRGWELAEKEILQRLAFLPPVSFEEYKVWFVPLFRKYCFQDEYAHGGSHLLDLPRVGDFGGIFDIKLDIELGKEKLTRSDALYYKEKSLLEKEAQESNTNWADILKEKDKSWLPSSKPTVTPENEWLYSRFAINNLVASSKTTIDPLERYKDFLKSVFDKEYEELQTALKAVMAKYKEMSKRSEEASAQEVQEDEKTPRSKDEWLDFKAKMAVCLSELINSEKIGFPLRYMSPTKKLNVLVIDDKGETTAKELQDESALGEVFTFYPLEINIPDALAEGDTIVNYAIDKIREEVETRRTYEIVLLDLSLAEDPGYDLMGYHIIYRIKQFMPQSKMVVYSKLDDMGHIVRALKHGASWYLRKYNKRKLPRHVYSMLRLMEWKKEWRTVWSNRLCGFTFENPEENKGFIRSFDGKRKYLTYKSLERYPGVMISIKPMKGGLSASATFKAVKGLIADGDPVQTPVIVKIDTAHATRLEYERYFRFIRPYIANESGRVENPEIVLDDETAAIVYTYAGKQDPYHDLDTMKAMFVRDIKSRSSCDYQKYEKTFDSIFNEILPQIHQVSPQVEFSPLEEGPADIAARDLRGVAQTNFSDYPNHAFGEFCKLESFCKDEETFAIGFLANYLCRMPIVRKLEKLDDKGCFVEQNGKLSVKKLNDDASQSNTYHYEYHDKNKIGECTITAYDLKDKCSVIMKGKAVDHIVKYRPYTYPCMALWVAKPVEQDDAIPNPVNTEVKSAEAELFLEEGLNNKIANAYNEENTTRAVNMFTEAVYDFLGENPCAGRPTSAYFQAVCDRNGVGDSFCKILEGIGDKANSSFQSVIRMKGYVDKLLEDKKLRKKLLDCPIGIVHGDLNCANIMLETRKNISKIVEFSDAVPNIRDVWFIDFARTRRDFISHDFNVMFTSVLGMLFDKDVWDGKLLSCNDMTYRTSNTGWQTAILRECATNRDQINAVYRDFIIAAVTGDLDAVPDFIEKDKRMSFVFRVLRRIRKAALRAGISEECYLLTTALSCTVASRIAIVHEKNAPASAAMIAAAVICLAEIKS